LIVRMNFVTGKVFIRHVLTHSEYSRGKWKSS
jgi:mRNA-degrading endonuclease HigB of HigAB toxin-antitoxin module